MEEVVYVDSCTVLDIGKEVFKGSLEKVKIIYQYGKLDPKHLHENMSSYTGADKNT